MPDTRATNSAAKPSRRRSTSRPELGHPGQRLAHRLAVEHAARPGDEPHQRGRRRDARRPAPRRRPARRPGPRTSPRPEAEVRGGGARSRVRLSRPPPAPPTARPPGVPVRVRRSGRWRVTAAAPSDRTTADRAGRGRSVHDSSVRSAARTHVRRGASRRAGGTWSDYGGRGRASATHGRDRRAAHTALCTRRRRPTASPPSQRGGAASSTSQAGVMGTSGPQAVAGRRDDTSGRRSRPRRRPGPSSSVVAPTLGLDRTDGVAGHGDRGASAAPSRPSDATTRREPAVRLALAGIGVMMRPRARRCPGRRCRRADGATARERCPERRRGPASGHDAAGRRPARRRRSPPGGRAGAAAAAGPAWRAADRPPSAGSS